MTKPRSLMLTAICLSAAVSLTLRAQAPVGPERLLSLTKADLREYAVLTTSPMPSYKDLTADELADLIAYLLSLKG